METPLPTCSFSADLTADTRVPALLLFFWKSKIKSISYCLHRKSDFILFKTDILNVCVKWIITFFAEASHYLTLNVNNSHLFIICIRLYADDVIMLRQNYFLQTSQVEMYPRVKIRGFFFHSPLASNSSTCWCFLHSFPFIFFSSFLQVVQLPKQSVSR